MLATLAHEQHQPVGLSGDETVGATELPRCVYDRGRHSHGRLQVSTVARFIIGSAAEAIDVPPTRTEKTKSNMPPSGLRLQCCHRITEWVFNRDTSGNRLACQGVRSTCRGLVRPDPRPGAGRSGGRRRSGEEICLPGRRNCDGAALRLGMSGATGGGSRSLPLRSSPSQLRSKEFSCLRLMAESDCAVCAPGLTPVTG